MGGSASKKRSSRSERCCRSRNGYSQECFDYVFDYLPPRCSYLNEPTADEPSASSSSSSYSEPGRDTANSQPLPSAPVQPFSYEDEEEKQIDMAITASLEVPNFHRESSTSSMSSSSASDDEEERQIDTAIWASLNPSCGVEWSSDSSQFESGSSSSSSQRKEDPNHFSGELGGCGICFEVISMPAICDPCGHVSCHDCLQRIHESGTSRCPRCRGAITKVMRIYM